MNAKVIKFKTNIAPTRNADKLADLARMIMSGSGKEAPKKQGLANRNHTIALKKNIVDVNEKTRRRGLNYLDREPINISIDITMR